MEWNLIFVRESLSEPHSNVENDTMAHMQKTELQHTIIDWYGGSCTIKCDKLMDTFIQVLCNAELFNFVYICKYVHICVHMRTYVCLCVCENNI